MRNVLIVAAMAISLCTSASVAIQPSAEGRAQPVGVILSDLALTPQSLRHHYGQIYWLRFVSRSSGHHNFPMLEFFSAAHFSLAEAAAVPGGKIEPDKLRSRLVQFILAAGSYPVTCTHFLHISFGMPESIVVS